MEHGVRSFVAKALHDLRRVASTETTGKVRIRLMIAALVPPDFHHMGPLWALWIAGGMPDLAGRLALAIADCLGAELPHYTVPIGWGILGILRGCVSPVWVDSARDDVVNLAVGMAHAVELYDQWETRRGDGIDPKTGKARVKKRA